MQEFIMVNRTLQSDIRVNRTVLKYSALITSMGPAFCIYVALCTMLHTTESAVHLVSEHYVEPTLGGGRLAVMGQRT